MLVNAIHRERHMVLAGAISIKNMKTGGVAYRRFRPCPVSPEDLICKSLSDWGKPLKIYLNLFSEAESGRLGNQSAHRFLLTNRR